MGGRLRVLSSSLVGFFSRAAALPPLLVVALSSSCGDESSTHKVEDSGAVGRRVFRPPPRAAVRAVPPHNIHAKGVGPYELGADLHSMLALLPTGPRVELFEVDGLFDYHLVRADNNALTIGVLRRGGVEFVSVLDPDIARTESGVGVGAQVQELVVALGAVEPETSGKRDPRLVVFSALPNTRFVVEGNKVIAAVVVRRAASRPEKSEAVKVAERDTEEDKEVCNPAALVARRREVLKAADLDEGARVSFGCIGQASAPVAAVWRGERVLLILTEGEELRRLGPLRVPGLDFVGIVEVGQEWGVYAVVQQERPEAREVEIVALRTDGTSVATEPPRTALRLSASSAGYVGARLSDAHFLVELRGGQHSLEVSGLFVQRASAGLRNVVPVLPTDVPVGAVRPPTPRTRRRSAPASGATSLDAGSDAPGDAGGGRDAGSP